jgi:broad specificity phosphatase PhoE
LVVVLVRHAEKINESVDPDLNQDGYERAGDLARVLSDAGIQFIHSSDFKRTRRTAGPLANQLELEIEIYDKWDLHALADHVKNMGGRHLVVGHSNTTPALVELFGGDPGPPIEEMFEYDRLYILSFDRYEVNTVLLRYGPSCSSTPSSNMASSLLVPQTPGSALNRWQTLGLSGLSNIRQR